MKIDNFDDLKKTYKNKSNMKIHNFDDFKKIVLRVICQVFLCELHAICLL